MESPSSSSSSLPPKYLSGFDNTFESEHVDGSLPRNRNNPRSVPFGLYTEQLSGTAFTRPRHVNRRTWFYRKQPSAVHNPTKFVDSGEYFGGADPIGGILDPNPMRWSPFTPHEGDTTTTTTTKTFITGMHLLGAAGEPPTKNGLAIYIYLFNDDMNTDYIYNSDGDLLIVPQEGGLIVKTEMGILHVCPKEICVIPRGIVFSIQRLLDVANTTTTTTFRGYLLEVYKGHFTLPELGPIGSNGLANARDFLYPTAWCEENEKKNKVMYNKFGSKLWSKSISSSPFDVVAWHGNYLPFKYDLSHFCAVNSVTYDHMDPSIYTVLTCVGDETGTALCDFVIFPPRWMSTDPNTFRPPWFHRNTMTEFMGNIYGSYDAKKGFLPGGASLHSFMTPHGPDTVSYANAMADPCETPTYYDSLSFMFETSHMLRLTDFALNCSVREHNYGDCWKDLPDEKKVP
mmetsp:Transcript_31299/g.75703  ORF Transcript_31299/g.75703 Transcript_31299/m.75703 type:complete len:457 (-) Transcript_31299:166-1536(-)